VNAPAPAVITDRTRYVGGSDAAGILGASRYETPLSVFLWKIGEPTEEMLDHRAKMAKIFRRGKREEPHVIDDLAEDYGVKITKRSTPERPNRYVDPEFPFLAAEVDFEWEVTENVAALVSDQHPEIAALIRKLVGTTQNGEVKTHHIFAKGQFGDDGTDQTPVEYAAQALHGLGVTGRQLTMFGVRSSLDDLRVYWIVRDDGIIKTMRPRLVNFWQNHVLARVEPEPYASPTSPRSSLGASASRSRPRPRPSSGSPSSKPLSKRRAPRPRPSRNTSSSSAGSCWAPTPSCAP